MSVKLDIEQVDGLTLQNIQNWSDAYLWGNHDLAGYLKGRGLHNASNLAYTAHQNAVTYWAEGGGFTELYGTSLHIGSYSGWYNRIDMPTQGNVLPVWRGINTTTMSKVGNIYLFPTGVTPYHSGNLPAYNGVSGLRTGTGNSYIMGDITLLGGTNTTMSTNASTKTFTINGPSTGSLTNLNTTASTTVYHWTPSILNQWVSTRGFLTEVPEASNVSVGGMKLASDIPGGTPNPVSNVPGRWYAIQLNGEGHAVVNIPISDDGSDHVNKVTSNIINPDTFSLDSIGGAFKLTNSGMTLIGNESIHPGTEDWDTNFEVSLEEKMIRMWSSVGGHGYNFLMNAKGSTLIRIPDSSAPITTKVLPLQFTMNGATYQANNDGVVSLPNSVSNTTFTNNTHNNTTVAQTITLTNTSYPRVERVFYGGTTNGTLTINKYGAVDGDEILIHGKQCTISIKSSTTVNAAIFSSDSHSTITSLRLADVSLVGGEIRQFVHLRYMANYQAWVVLSASLR